MDVNIFTASGVISFIVSLFVLINYNYSLFKKYQIFQYKIAINNIILTFLTLTSPFTVPILIKQSLTFFEKDIDSSFYIIFGTITGAIIGFLGTDLSSRRQKRITNVQRLQEKLETLYNLTEKSMEKSNEITGSLTMLQEAKNNQKINRYLTKKMLEIFTDQNNQYLEESVSKMLTISNLYFPNLLNKVEDYKKSISEWRTQLAPLQLNLAYFNNPDAFGDIGIKIDINDINQKINTAYNKNQNIKEKYKNLEEEIQKEAERLGVPHN